MEIETDEERRRLWPRRRNFTIFVVGATVLLWLVLALAGPARADDQSYVRYLNDHGIAIGVNSPSIQLAAGRMICDNVRAGADPRAGMNFLDRGLVPDAAVDAAQHQLCPDTLH